MLHRTDMFIKASKDDEGVYEFVASTNRVDRQGDIVEQNFDFKQFKQNPVLLWGHDYSAPPIGKVVKVWTQKREKANGTADKETRARVKFVDAEIYPFAGMVKEMVEQGFLSAVSIGFRPLERAQVSDEEREKLGMGPWGERFTKSEWLELSIAPVPANPDAVLAGVSKGLFTEEAKALGKADPLEGADYEAINKALDEIECLIDAEIAPAIPSQESDAALLLKGIERLTDTIGLLVNKTEQPEDQPRVDDDEDEADSEPEEDLNELLAVIGEINSTLENGSNGTAQEGA